jgi:hypothetical protein
LIGGDATTMQLDKPNQNGRTRQSSPREAEPVQLGRAFDHERTVFTVCASMVGVCLTAIGLIRVVENFGAIRTLSRIALAVNALVYLLAALFSFAAMRSHVRGRPSPLVPIADAAMLLGLIGTVLVCFALVFTLT